MKKVVLGVLGVVGLMGCNELKGNMTVAQPFNLLNDSKKVVAIPQGNYAAELKADEGKRTIELKIKSVQGKDQKLVIQVPTTVVMPSDNGEVDLAGAQIGQEFDFKGTVNTDITSSERTRTTESCTYYTRERVCRWVRNEASVDNAGDGDRGGRGGGDGDRGGRGGDGDRGGRGGGDGDRGGRQECSDQQVAHSGRQEVEYHFVETDKTARAVLSKAGVSVAQYSGSLSKNDKVYDYSGSCN